jgi:hypothetical protein
MVLLRGCGSRASSLRRGAHWLLLLCRWGINSNTIITGLHTAALAGSGLVIIGCWRDSGRTAVAVGHWFADGASWLWRINGGWLLCLALADASNLPLLRTGLFMSGSGTEDVAERTMNTNARRWAIEHHSNLLARFFMLTCDWHDAVHNNLCAGARHIKRGQWELGLFTRLCANGSRSSSGANRNASLFIIIIIHNWLWLSQGCAKGRQDGLGLGFVLYSKLQARKAHASVHHNECLVSRPKIGQN